MELRARAVDLHVASPLDVANEPRAWRAAPLGGILARARRSPRLRRAARRLGVPAGRVTVVQVELYAGGLVGFGEAKPLRRHGETVESALRFLDVAAERIAALSGPDALLAGALDSLPAGELAARAALDVAAHDLAGKRAGVPVWRLLGLARSGPRTSFTLSLADPDATARAAERAARRFAVLKLKLGGADGLDLERVRAVRRTTSARLRVDANEGWRLDEALDVVPALAELGVEMVEQPLPARDPGGPRLKDASPVPVFVDEDCRTADDLEECARRAHGVNVKLSKCGGLRAALDCAERARALGLGTMIGCMLESSLGIAAAVHVASRFDHADLDANLMLDDDPFAGLVVEDGRQVPADAPGLGVRRVRA